MQMYKGKAWAEKEISGVLEKDRLAPESEYLEGKDWGLRVALSLIYQLEEPGKPVIPQFVADWFEGVKDGSVFTVATGVNDFIFEFAQQYYEGSIPFELKDWYLANSKTFYLACLYGYEVEKEKEYRLKMGNGYVFFNLDGGVRSVKKQNAIISESRLAQLPFNVEKAVETGIIKLEEVTE